MNVRNRGRALLAVAVTASTMLVASFLLGGTAFSNGGSLIVAPTPSTPSTPSTAPTASPVIDLCQGLAGLDETCIIEWLQPDGPMEPGAPGEAAGEGSPTADPMPCPPSLLGPPDLSPVSVLNLYLDCLDVGPTPLPTQTAAVRSTSLYAPLRQQPEEPKKYIGTTSFAVAGTKPLLGGDTRTLKKTMLIIEAKDKVVEFTGVIVVDVEFTDPKNNVTKKKLRFNTWSKRDKHKDPNTGREIDGFLAEASFDPAVEVPVGTKMVGTIRGVIGAVLLKDESEDRPLKFEQSAKSETIIK